MGIKGKKISSLTTNQNYLVWEIYCLRLEAYILKQRVKKGMGNGVFSKVFQGKCYFLVANICFISSLTFYTGCF